MTNREFSIITCMKSGTQLTASGYKSMGKVNEHVRERVACMSGPDITKFVVIGPDAEVVELDSKGLNRNSRMQQIVQEWHRQDIHYGLVK